MPSDGLSARTGRSRRRRPRPGRGRRSPRPRRRSARSRRCRCSPRAGPGSPTSGSATRPSWMCQRSTTWVARLAVRLAISTTIGSARSSSPEPPIGLHDSVTMPCSASKARLRVPGAVGLSWIWLTSGRHPGLVDHAARWVGLKFDTPMALIEPSSSSAPDPARPRRTGPWSGLGQWTISRSR